MSKSTKQESSKITVDSYPEWIEKALNDENYLVRMAAVDAFKGREVPLEWIEKALKG